MCKMEEKLVLLLSGKAGKEFIDEITRMINEWSNETPLRGIALKAVTVMPSLLLQKPKRNSKAKEHTEVLKRRLLTWKNGDIDSLVREARFIQSNLPTHKREGFQQDIEKIQRVDVIRQGEASTAHFIGY